MISVELKTFRKKNFAVLYRKLAIKMFDFDCIFHKKDNKAFDFHPECRHMHWDELNNLMYSLAHKHQQRGYFLLPKDVTMLSVDQSWYCKSAARPSVI